MSARPAVTLSRLEAPTFPSLLGRYELRVGDRRYLVVRCTYAQALRMRRQVATDIALPAINAQLRSQT